MVSGQYWSAAQFAAVVQSLFTPWVWIVRWFLCSYPSKEIRARSSRAEEETSFREKAETGKVALTWVRQTRLGLSAAFRAGKWAYRAKSRVAPTGSAALRPQRSESKLEPAAIAAATAPAPVASASRPESTSASKYAVAPGEREAEIIDIVKDLT